MKYNLVTMGDQENLTLFLDGEMYVASNTHPNWPTIKRMVVMDADPDVVDYFDVPRSVAKRLETLSERVSIDGETVYFDGDPIDNSLTKQIVRFLSEGVDDWKPLVAFLEKVSLNPQQHSREQLYDFLSNHDITITEDGDVIGYKSVISNGDGGFRSVTAGKAFVNGEEKTGQIPQVIGDVVTMPRSEVAFDPSTACSTGLHVANWRYASTWSHTADTILKVAYNPRDVVSVPTDSNSEKVRVSRYKVLAVVTDELKTAVAHDDLDEDEELEEDEWSDDYASGESWNW